MAKLATVSIVHMLCMLSQPTGSLSFYKEVHDFMKQYSSDASERYLIILCVAMWPVIMCTTLQVSSSRHSPQHLMIHLAILIIYKGLIILQVCAELKMVACHRPFFSMCLNKVQFGRTISLYIFNRRVIDK